ncbi:MAG TPA: hypothetical protein VGL40_07900 [Bacillota bacterium]
MRSFALEFEKESDVREEYQRLTQKMGLTGEFGIKPTGGKWRLEVITERELGESAMAKLKGTLVDG